MDRVRFGRALGYGARHAAKSLISAVDAAASPNPASTSPANPPQAATRHQPVATASAAGFRSPAPGPRQATGRPAASSVSERIAEAHTVVRQSKAHAGHLRRSVWSPLAKFSSVVWLEVTGTFFALVAAYLSQGLWRQRGAVHLPLSSPVAGKLYLHAVAFAIFAYFAVSSFVRARIRQRRSH